MESINGDASVSKQAAVSAPRAIDGDSGFRALRTGDLSLVCPVSTGLSHEGKESNYISLL